MGQGVIVADTNLIVYFLIDGALTQCAEAWRAADRNWIVPPLFRFELASVLSGMVAEKKLSRDVALRSFRRGLSLVRVYEFQTDPQELFSVAERTGCSTYDLEFYLLATREGCRLITADKQLIKAFPEVACDLQLSPEPF